MADISALVAGVAKIDAGGCPSPFLSEDLYPFHGGWKGSRVCSANILSANAANASLCCLPCPLVDYLYDDNFQALTNGTAWVHVGAFILCTFLLLSMIVLPRESRRAYLNIVLLVGVLIFDLGFIVPLARQPPECFDPITNTSQGDNFTCAISGALVAFGGLFLVVWVLVRALFMHLQIVWNVVPGKKSYIAANVVAFSVTIGLTTAMLIVDGVSIKWGHYCHVNIPSLATYWGWLLSFAGLSLALQLATFIYVAKVFVQNKLVGGNKSVSTVNSSAGTQVGTVSSARKVRVTAHRVRQALLLQWRSLAIAWTAVFITLFVCLIFVVFNTLATDYATANDAKVLFPWILCLVTTQQIKSCHKYIEPYIISERMIIATLFIMSSAGIFAFLLLCRWEVFTGWRDLGRRTYTRYRKRRSGSIGSFSGGTEQRPRDKEEDLSSPVDHSGKGSYDDEEDMTTTIPRQRRIPDEEADMTIVPRQRLVRDEETGRTIATPRRNSISDEEDDMDTIVPPRRLARGNELGPLQMNPVSPITEGQTFHHAK